MGEKNPALTRTGERRMKVDWDYFKRRCVELAEMKREVAIRSWTEMIGEFWE